MILPTLGFISPRSLSIEDRVDNDRHELDCQRDSVEASRCTCDKFTYRDTAKTFSSWRNLQCHAISPAHFVLARAFEAGERHRPPSEQLETTIEM